MHLVYNRSDYKRSNEIDGIEWLEFSEKKEHKRINWAHKSEFVKE